MHISSTGGGNDPLPPDNSLAEQALNTANTALAEVQALTAAQKQIRGSPPQEVNSGDSVASFSFLPPMPSTDYWVCVTYYAGNSNPVPDAKVYNARVLESSITTTGFTLVLDNTPTSTKIGITVTER